MRTSDAAPESLADFHAFKGTPSYIASNDLRDAVNVAISLARPLLVKGEPGTGKTLLAQAIAEGLGMAFVSDLAVRAELASNNLVEIPVDEFSVRREFFLVRRDGKLLSPAAQAFVSIALKEHDAA